MGDTDITISPAGGTWVLRAAGAVLGESRSALMLEETGHAPVVYFPREDIEMAFFDPSDHRTTCPHKGEASYYSLVAKSGTYPNAAWSYEDPKEAVAAIRGHLAFYTGDMITVEKL